MQTNRCFTAQAIAPSSNTETNFLPPVAANINPANNRSFDCNQSGCYMSFNTSKQLVNHARQHKTPTQCSYCEMIVKPRDMVRHIRETCKNVPTLNNPALIQSQGISLVEGTPESILQISQKSLSLTLPPNSNLENSELQNVSLCPISGSDSTSIINQSSIKEAIDIKLSDQSVVETLPSNLDLQISELQDVYLEPEFHLSSITDQIQAKSQEFVVFKHTNTGVDPSGTMEISDAEELDEKKSLSLAERQYATFIEPFKRKSKLKAVDHDHFAQNESMAKKVMLQNKINQFQCPTTNHKLQQVVLTTGQQVTASKIAASRSAAFKADVKKKQKQKLNDKKSTKKLASLVQPSRIISRNSIHKLEQKQQYCSNRPAILTPMGRVEALKTLHAKPLGHRYARKKFRVQQLAESHICEESEIIYIRGGFGQPKAICSINNMGKHIRPDKPLQKQQYQMPEHWIQQVNQMFFDGTSAVHYCICGHQCWKPSMKKQQDTLAQATPVKYNPLSTRHQDLNNISCAILENAARSDFDCRANEAAILENYRLIDEKIKNAGQVQSQLVNMINSSRTLQVSDPNIINYDGQQKAIVPDLNEEEVSWIRKVTLESLYVQRSIINLCIKRCKNMPVRKANLHKIRNVLYSKKHKFLRYVFDGKGGYGNSDSIVYDLSGIFEEYELDDANFHFKALKNVTVNRGQKIPNYVRFDMFLTFIAECHVQIEKIIEGDGDLDQSQMPEIEHKRNYHFEQSLIQWELYELNLGGPYIEGGESVLEKYNAQKQAQALAYMSQVEAQFSYIEAGQASELEYTDLFLWAYKRQKLCRPDETTGQLDNDSHQQSIDIMADKIRCIREGLYKTQRHAYEV